MMLVHKPISNIQLAQFSHRRHPSAPPAVIVQPTRTPGLLSLSKPIHNSPKPSPQRQLPSNQRSAKQTPRTASKHQVVRAQVQAPPSPPPEGAEKRNANAPQPRGRSAKQVAAAAKRSASPSSNRGKHGRQPSPPVSQPQEQSSSQAEVHTLSSTNLFDPFIDHSSSPPAMSNLAPALASRPSGKLARRRQQQNAAATTLTPPATPSPVLAKAIPVPRPTNNNTRQNRAFNELSRSDPVRSNIVNRKPHLVSKRSETAVFPICDDMTDAGDDSDSEEIPLPTTPTRRNGPRTAPLSSHGSFPFNLKHLPSPAPTKRATVGFAAGKRYHQRTPSDGMFNMSSDEDAGISSVSGSKLSPGVQALFGLMPSTPNNNRSTPPPSNKGEYSYPSPFSTPVPARAVPATYPRHAMAASMADREAEFEREAEREVKGYFASSLFQNSPSPEELPDPIFV